MLRRIRDAPRSAGADDAAHRRAVHRDVLPGQRGERAARRRHLDHAVGSQQPERGAVGLGDVSGRLEKSVEHASRIELQRDLLAEPPHAVQDALRVVQLEGALCDALLERDLDGLLLRHAMLEALRGPPLGDDREAAVEREQGVQCRHRHRELQARRGAEPLHRQRRRVREHPQLSRTQCEGEQCERAEDDAHQPTRRPRNRERGGGKRGAGEDEHGADGRAGRLPWTQQQHAEQHDARELRERDEPGREAGWSDGRVGHAGQRALT